MTDTGMTTEDSSEVLAPKGREDEAYAAGRLAGFEEGIEAEARRLRDIVMALWHLHCEVLGCGHEQIPPCGDCAHVCEECGGEWPCETVRLLTGGWDVVS